jgi:hypothetical protein
MLTALRGVGILCGGMFPSSQSSGGMEMPLRFFEQNMTRLHEWEIGEVQETIHGEKNFSTNSRLTNGSVLSDYWSSSKSHYALLQE